jgi:hypothetical protein
MYEYESWAQLTVGVWPRSGRWRRQMLHELVNVRWVGEVESSGEVSLRAGDASQQGEGGDRVVHRVVLKDLLHTGGVP